MTITARRREQRGFPISQGGWGGFFGDPSAIPPPSAFNMGAAGVVVNERTVLSLMVVASCIRVLGDAASGLEPHVYRQKGNRRSRQDPEVDPPEVIVDPYADLDREDGDFRLVASLGLNGNLVKHIVERDDAGNPATVEVLNPSVLKVEMVNGRKTYSVTSSGQVIPAKDIVHVPWLSLAGGLVGLNPIEIGANGFGIPLAANEYAARYFAQGMHPSGFISLEKPLRPEDAKRLEQDLQTKHGGLSQSHTPIVLDSAAKWNQISITPETAQLLQSRAFSRGEICGFYGVPGHLIGDTNPGDQGGPWGKGLQEMVMGFALFSLSGYTRRLDRADTALLPAGYYCKRDIKQLFETNSQMLGQFVQMLRMASVASPNEARELAGLPRSDEPAADSLFAPINSAHSDFLAPSGYGAESGEGVPAGTVDGGEPSAKGPEGGQ